MSPGLLWVLSHKGWGTESEEESDETIGRKKTAKKQNQNEERRGSGCGKVKIKCQGRPEKRGWFINASSQSQHGGTQWPYHWGSPDGVGLRERSRVRGGQSRGVKVLSKTQFPRKTQTSHSYSSPGLDAVALTHAAKEAIVNYYWKAETGSVLYTDPFGHGAICIYP